MPILQGLCLGIPRHKHECVHLGQRRHRWIIPSGESVLQVEARWRVQAVGYPRIDLVAEHGQARLVGRDHGWEELHWAQRGADAVQHLTLPPEALGNARYTAAFRHFLSYLQSGQTPSASVEDGVRAVALAMAVYESARTGQPVGIVKE